MIRDINVLLDVSMSMKECIAMIYLFLYELDRYLAKNTELEVRYRLTWFASNKSERVMFENGAASSTTAREPGKFFARMKTLQLKKGRPTNETDLANGWKTMFDGMEGNAEEQIVLFFSDYRMRGEVSLAEERGVQRVLLFTPGDSRCRYRFHTVNQYGKFQLAMPAVQWPLEQLKEEWDEPMWECLTDYLGIWRGEEG